ncbi:hypothetical protein BjapCC829_31605 [Bradyrhizobium barranii]|uniref:Uncharacterized protein n=1 Tax=Bradyrhizobium barranii TaxID=2992140 RepID=A0ABY3QF31_9BRAD|nr:hypothetical protein [Bradyrhizobium japonicum]UFW84468.1 hypothetical protein BjapCC829_31605 [Bradyrhizobium japonicum]
MSDQPLSNSPPPQTHDLLIGAVHENGDGIALTHHGPDQQQQRRRLDRLGRRRIDPFDRRCGDRDRRMAEKIGCS